MVKNHRNENVRQMDAHRSSMRLLGNNQCVCFNVFPQMNSSETAATNLEGRLFKFVENISVVDAEAAAARRELSL